MNDEEFEEHLKRYDNLIGGYNCLAVCLIGGLVIGFIGIVVLSLIIN